MKKLLPFFAFFAALLATKSASAQIENPVTWSYSATKKGAKNFDVHLTAAIAPGWHLYAQEAGEGPEPTTIAFTKNPILTVSGKTKELGTLHKEYDKNFASELKYFENKVDFVQPLVLKAAVNTVAKGNITYMVCNDRKCLPPKTVPFAVAIRGK